MRSLAVLVLAALLAGCTAPADHPALQASAETREVPESTAYPGLTVRGTLGADGDRLAVAAVATNAGDRTYDVETGCSSPWSQQLYRGNTSVTMRRPTTPCGQGEVAFTTLEPGTSRTYDVHWDGTVWDPQLNRQVSAQPGDYTWSIRFVAYPNGGDNVAAKRFDLDFSVTVL